MLHTRWKHPHGGRLKVDAAVLDSGDGDWTEKVYAFCFPRLSRRVLAGKGVSGTWPAIQASQSKVKGGRLFLIGVDGLKNTILNRLSRGRSVRFSVTLEPAYFEQLASERKIVRYTRGQPVRRFERKPGMRAEALDCMVYGFAARHMVTVPAERREEELCHETQAAPPSAVIRSKWLNR